MMEKYALPIEKSKSGHGVFLAIGIVLVCLVVAVLYYTIVARDTGTTIYDFSDPKYETENFEIDIVDLHQLYRSGFEFNCTVIKNKGGDVLENPTNMLVKDYYRLRSWKYPIGDATSVSLNTPRENYDWDTYPNGSMVARSKFNESFSYPEKEAKRDEVIWFCQKVELDDDLFRPPEELDFEPVSTSWNDLSEQLAELSKKLEDLAENSTE